MKKIFIVTMMMIIVLSGGIVIMSMQAFSREDLYPENYKGLGNTKLEQEEKSPPELVAYEGEYSNDKTNLS